MSKHEEYKAGKEARRTVLHHAGHQGGTGDHTEALLRYMKAAGQAPPAETGRTKPLSDAEIRAQTVDLLIDAGGEATAAIVASGHVCLRGRIGCRSAIALLEGELWKIPGVTSVDLRLAYDIDDV